MTGKNRKVAYKVPPSTVTDLSESQQLRRTKALEEQKRKRAQRVESSRQLDLFAGLNLGQSDDEDDAEDPGVVRMGIASYAALLPASAPEASASASDMGIETFSSAETPERRKKKKRKQKSKKETPAASNKWADQCMYAELLEMSEDDPWAVAESSGSSHAGDGLPEDLETGWIAVAPVPQGKRCLVVTDQSLGVPGLVPNTLSKKQETGKASHASFPVNTAAIDNSARHSACCAFISKLISISLHSDCILDNGWRENGILHVLDVLKWKGQDIGDCETPFRFWWRDTRLEELPNSPPPSTSNYNQPSDPNDSIAQKMYRFPYPTKYLAIPYHTDTSLLALTSQIIPLARASRSIDVEVPVIGHDAEAESMAVDESQKNEPAAVFETRTAEVCADGLLLYVAEASYEAGTSPLSSWIPIANYEEDHGMSGSTTSTDGPLDVFHRLVQKRIARNSNSSNEYNSSFVTNSSSLQWT